MSMTPRTSTNATYRKLDRLVQEGRAQLVCTTLDTIFISGPTTTLLEPPPGQCAIITKIISTGLTTADTSPALTGPQVTFGFAMGRDGISFLQGSWIAFDRNDTVWSSPSDTSWKSAHPFVPIVWEPTDPIVIPPTWQLTLTTDGFLNLADMGGASLLMRGYLIDVGTARALGFEVHDYDVDDPTPNSLNLRSGCNGTIITAAGFELLAGRAGQHIQILDVYARQQQGTHAPTITWTMKQTTNNRVIFKGCNNNPGDFAEWKFSPGIYLEEGEGLTVIGDAGIRASITVTFRYVDADKVPSDEWWCYVIPGYPTPAVATTGLLSLFKTASDELNLYYPKLNTTATSPGKGRQHVVNGYAISAQKDTTPISQDQLFIALTTGTTGSQVGISAAAQITGGNKHISPVFGLSSHDQAIYFAESDIGVYCIKDTGKLFLDMTAAGVGGLATPNHADLHIDELHVLVWGRTTPTVVQNADRNFGQV